MEPPILLTFISTLSWSQDFLQESPNSFSCPQRPFQCWKHNSTQQGVTSFKHIPRFPPTCWIKSQEPAAFQPSLGHGTSVLPLPSHLPALQATQLPWQVRTPLSFMFTLSSFGLWESHLDLQLTSIPKSQRENESYPVYSIVCCCKQHSSTLQTLQRFNLSVPQTLTASCE